MKPRIWTFELRKGSQVLEHFSCTCTDCHRKGDALATRIGSVECYAYNEPLNRAKKTRGKRSTY